VATETEPVLIERPQDGVVLVRINRPEARNALDMATRQALAAAFEGFQDDPSVRAIVLTGNEQAFAAGADLKEFVDAGAVEMLRRRAERYWNAIARTPQPVIAAINGYALGGGCELAMACTLRIAADTARLGQPEVNLGIIPGYGGTQRLARLVGKGAAFDLLLSGRHVTADEALRIGLVNRVVPASELMTAARQLAAALAEKAPMAVQYIIEAVNRGLEISFDKGQFLEATLFGLVASTDDMREGTAAFLEKRKAVFKGR